MSIALIYDPYVLRHETGPHPENAARLAAVVGLLTERGFFEGLPRLESGPAPPGPLLRVHEEPYLRFLQAVAERGGGYLTPDTVMSADSWQVALRASGAALRATAAVLAGEVDQAFALVRPPGHHARPAQGMGFCLLNNIAVAARAARDTGAERVLVVDYDVHHGNGTQEIFYADPSVLFFSTHQFPAYPGTGALEEIGQGDGRGATVNVPLPAGVGDAGYLRVYQEILPPVARRFRPDIILVSAGYDAHWTNSAYLSSIRMRVTVTGFARIVQVVRDLARELCGDRMVLVLEGGYDPEALAWSVAGTLDTLLGRGVEDPIGTPRDALREPALTPLLDRVRQIHGL